jgi:D-lactate dehydrogenase
MKIALFSSTKYDKYNFNRVKNKHIINYIDCSLNSDTAILAKGSKCICVSSNDLLDKYCIEILAKHGVKLIALRCMGFNNIDLEAAKRYEIVVLHVQNYSPHCVAEHTMALLLTLNRKTHKAYSRMMESNLSLDGLEGVNLFGKKIGIIGLGKIGQCVADICKGFGCIIQAHDPFINKADIPLVTLEELYKSSDIISLHCPLTDKTHHVINKESIAKMKESVMLINTGRGALIDSNALIDGLKNNKFSNVGLDVYEQATSSLFGYNSTKITQDETLEHLMSFPNVLITNHQGFFTYESLDEIAKVTIKNITDIEKNNRCDNKLC